MSRRLSPLRTVEVAYLQMLLNKPNDAANKREEVFMFVHKKQYHNM